MPSLSSAEIVFFLLSCALFMGWQAFFFFTAVIRNDRAADAADAAVLERRAAWKASLEEYEAPQAAMEAGREPGSG